MKIILIIIGALLYSYLLMVISWTHGFMRSLKLLSTRGQKRSKYEKHCIKQVFEKKSSDIDPFFKSLYLKQEYEKINILKQKIAEKKEVQKKNKKNVKKNVKKTKK